MSAPNIKVIFDTNVWISFLIGKRLASIKQFIVTGQITLIVTDQLLNEIKEVTRRPRLQKYFSQESVTELLELMDMIALKIEIKPTHFICRDEKDNFLLDLVHFSEADYLVTGDKDLLMLHPFRTASVLSPADFERALSGLHENT